MKPPFCSLLLSIIFFSIADYFTDLNYDWLKYKCLEIK